MEVPTYSPREIVGELDRFIVGQTDAKRAVAIALRNRWRRQRLANDEAIEFGNDFPRGIGWRVHYSVSMMMLVLV